MKLLVINNLASGLGDGAIFDYIRSFVADNDEIVLRNTSGKTDLRTFLYDADEYDAVVVSGGDGSIACVAYELADTAIPILPFPAGTANLLATNLESPNEPHALVEMTRTFETLDFDIGEITLSDGTKHGFTIMAGAGYDATIMKDAEDGKKLLGQMAYFTSALNNATPQFSRLSLMLDGKHIETSGVGVLVINFSKIQFDLSVIHDNKPNDGYLDVVVFNTKDAYGLIPAFLAAILDKSGDFPNRTEAFEIYRAKEIYVEADPPLPVQFDGEALKSYTPFSIKILPEAVRIIVSQAAKALYS